MRRAPPQHTTCEGIAAAGAGREAGRIFLIIGRDSRARSVSREAVANSLRSAERICIAAPELFRADQVSGNVPV